MSDFEITDLGKFLEEQSETIVEKEHEEKVEEDNHKSEEDIDEEDVLVTKQDAEDSEVSDELDSDYSGDMAEHCETFCLQCVRMYANVHLWHLQTGSYAEHEALEDYYEDLFELTDTFIESAIANEGGMSCETTFNLEMIPYCDMLDEIESFKNLIEEHKQHVSEEGMINVMDDMFTITDEVLYKVKNLK